MSKYYLDEFLPYLQFRKHCKALLHNSKNPSCINLILNNKQERPLKVKTVKPGLSEFEKPIVSVFKTNFQK